MGFLGGIISDMKKCAFCDVDNMKDRTIAENEFAYAFPSFKPIGIAHLLVVPKKHREFFDDMTKEEQNAVMDLQKKLKIALKKTFDNVAGFNCAWNEGETSGQSVSHYHFHLIPRATDDHSMYGYEPREFLYRRPLQKDNTPDK